MFCSHVLTNKKIVSFVTVFFILLFNLNAKTGKNVLHKKANFILEAASKMSYPTSAKEEHYIIGIYGKGKEINRLVQELENIGEDKFIHGREVVIHHFRNVKRVKPVDLLYITGDSKVRLSDLNKKLIERPYILLTENFPFGTSLLNMAMNKENNLFFEIQDDALTERGITIDKSILSSSSRVTNEKDWKMKLANAIRVIEKHKKVIAKHEEVIQKNEEVIENNEEVIEKQSDQIEEKSDEIKEKAKTISNQRTAIIIGIISILIISGLLLLLFRLNKERQRALNHVMASINYAKRLQDAILPSKETIHECFPQSFIFFNPKDVVSGDFYWLEQANDHVFFSVADCTGHGVPGAMLSMTCSNSLTKVVKELEIFEPAKVLDKTSEIVEKRFSKNGKDISDGMDIALCSINQKTKKMHYAGAKNPLYYIENGELITIKPNRQPIGKYIKRKPFTNHTIDLKKGQCFYLFSDGFADQFGGEEGKKFSYKKFRELLLSIHQKPMDEQKVILHDTIKSWQGDRKQIDDICIMGIRI